MFDCVGDVINFTSSLWSFLGNLPKIIIALATVCGGLWVFSKQQKHNRIVKVYYDDFIDEINYIKSLFDTITNNGFSFEALNNYVRNKILAVNTIVDGNDDFIKKFIGVTQSGYIK